MLRKVLTTILLLAVFLIAGSVAMSCASRRMPTLGVIGGESGGGRRLTPCPDSPNCVNSQEDDAEHGIAALRFGGEPSVALEQLAGLLENTPRVKIVEHTGDYLRAEFTSGLLRFVDDVEFLVLPAEKVIHVRSASRVGHSDLGANRKRVETLRARWTELASE